ncbi:valine--tRNA ligase-like [Anoplophora glabripennis]|uniref:valine--tRNA ligase-like n=1 Tax=Anoplophora glabripennis TaxID=217634 RepID=UPI00087520FF|nr:valine--tRNA ligase-like [Anoplophora glabripennis]
MYKLYKRCTLCSNKVRIIRLGFLRARSTKYDKEAAELNAGYVPHEVESLSLGRGYFEPPIRSNKPFTLVLPPPNITGTLHLGHALTTTVEDVLVRWHRMQGRETLWVPGIDHAGIATQVVVEKRLWKENRQTRHDIGRLRFQEKAWQWKEEKAKVIGQQLRRLGASLEWEREIFTMDQRCSNAVQEAFIRLFNANLIYRADHLVNWSCVLRSAISDIEVEHVNVEGPTNISVPGYEKPVEFGTLTKFAYKLKDSDEEIVVAMTRPETMLGDVAVAVHPEDQRHSGFVGRYLWHPFRKEAIPVISDPFVDREFGTGAVKITPAHDQTDFEVAKRHGLKHLQVIDETGNLTAACGDFSGLRRFDARDVVMTQLDNLGLLRGRQHHAMMVPICSRSGDVVEFLARPQWFVRCQEMATKAVQDVREGRLTIEPSHFEKTWFNWLENIRDWCISRQLWWGHQVPAYSCRIRGGTEGTLWIAAESQEAARRKAARQMSADEDSIEVVRDEDVLDTWFSSALQPFAAFGWPHQSEDLSKFYPLSLMETGHDILFFWVARMVMLGKELTGQLPFDRILLHGIICDAQGRKMSKSLGNVIAPEDVINGASLQALEEGSKASYAAGVLSEDELSRAVLGQKKMFPQGIPECGSDALRFTLMSHNVKNHFINFDVNECYTNKTFCNKIWQATKFVKLWFSNVSKGQDLREAEIDVRCLTLMDKWALSRLSFMVDTVNDGLRGYNFHVATAALKNFLYYDFCDVYLETTKRGLRIPNSPAAAGHCWTLLACLDIGLRALAPFMPTLCQHLHCHLPLFPGKEKSVDFPKDLNWRDEGVERDVNEVMDVVVAIRRLKKIFNVTAKHRPQVHLVNSSLHLANFGEIIQDLSACQAVNVSHQIEEVPLKNTVRDSVRDTEIYLVVPDELRRAIELDLPKMERKKEKLLKELEKMNKMISGDTYKVNATPEAQQIHSNKITSLEEKLSRIKYIQTLSSQ